MNPTPAHPRTKAPLPPQAATTLVPLLFLATSFASLLGALALLLMAPERLTAELALETPKALYPLALLLLPGFLASGMFALLYALAAPLSGSSLGSPVLACTHLFLHLLSLGSLLTEALLNNQPSDLTPSVTAAYVGLIAGAILFAINTLLTACRQNQWNPSQLSLLSSVFWLCIAAGAGLLMLLENFTAMDSVQLAKVYLPVSLTSFAVFGTIAGIFLYATMFHPKARQSTPFAWLGWGLLNAALMIAVPQLLDYPGLLSAWLGLMLAAAMLLYAIDTVRRFLAGQEKPNLPQTGIVLAFVPILAAALWLASRDHLNLQSSVNPLWQKTGLALACLTGFVLFALPASTRIIPFLLWRLRCLPWVGRLKLPRNEELLDGRSEGVSVLCLLSGCLYLASGFALGAPAGIQLGALCLLAGSLWSLHSLAPALRLFFLGLTPMPTTTT